MAQIRVYKTNQNGVFASHKKSRETGKTFWRLYTKNAQGTLDSIGIKEESEIRRCELCGAVIIDKPRDRFCSDACCEESFRRMTVDAQENEFWSNDY